MEFFDSHAHYNDEKFSHDDEDIIKKIYREGITSVVVAGYNLKSSKEAVRLANQYHYLYAICGISPNDINEDTNRDIERIEELSKKNKKVIAMGEIGLDYYWNKENKERQKQCFIKQIEVANQLKLPIVIHSRDASIDTIEILNNTNANQKGVFHCCQLNMELIREALKLGFYISFAGPITYKNVKNAEEIVKSVPLDKVLIETDSPYLAPEPLRGTRNNSINVKRIAQKIADIKGISLEETAKITYENAKKAFHLS